MDGEFLTTSVDEWLNSYSIEMVYYNCLIVLFYLKNKANHWWWTQMISYKVSHQPSKDQHSYNHTRIRYKTKWGGPYNREPTNMCLLHQRWLIYWMIWGVPRWLENHPKAMITRKTPNVWFSSLVKVPKPADHLIHRHHIRGFPQGKGHQWLLGCELLPVTTHFWDGWFHTARSEHLFFLNGLAGHTCEVPDKMGPPALDVQRRTVGCRVMMEASMYISLLASWLLFQRCCHPTRHKFTGGGSGGSAFQPMTKGLQIDVYKSLEDVWKQPT